MKRSYSWSPRRSGSRATSTSSTILPCCSSTTATFSRRVQEWFNDYDTDYEHAQAVNTLEGLVTTPKAVQSTPFLNLATLYELQSAMNLPKKKVPTVHIG